MTLRKLGDYSSTANAIASGEVFTKDRRLSADVWLWSRIHGLRPLVPTPRCRYSPRRTMVDIFSDDADADTDFMVGFRASFSAARPPRAGARR